MLLRDAEAPPLPLSSQSPEGTADNEVDRAHPSPITPKAIGRPGEKKIKRFLLNSSLGYVISYIYRFILLKNYFIILLSLHDFFYFSHNKT